MARYELSIRDYYRIIRRHIVVVIAVAIGLGGMTYTFSIAEPEYRAAATVRYQRASDLTGLLLQTFYWSAEDNIATQVRLISSQPVLMEVGKNLGRIDRGLTLEDIADAGSNGADSLAVRARSVLAELSSSISARQVEYSSLIEISAVAATPQLATQTAKAAAEGYESYSTETLNWETRRRRAQIQDRVDIVAATLDSLQNVLVGYREENPNIGIPGDQTLTNLLDRRLRLDEGLRSVSDQLRRLRSGAEVVLTPGMTLTLTGGDVFRSNYEELISLYAERRRLLLTYKAGSDPIRLIDQRITEVRSALIEALESDRRDLREKSDGLRSDLADYPAGEIRLASLARQVELATQLHSQLQLNLQEVLIQGNEQRKEVYLINYPTGAAPTSQGNAPMKAIIGLLLGLMLGIVTAFILETLDTSIGTIEDVEEYLGVPVLAVIPHLSVERVAAQLVKENPPLADDPNLEMYARLITQYDPKSPTAEAYRTLRTNLQFATAAITPGDAKKNTFVLTSASLQEGKTTTIINLAITMAQAGNRVLLMGCNMRRPTIYKSFGLERDRGMTDILTGQLSWRECVKGVTDMMLGPLSLQSIMSMPGLDNLHVLTAGGIPPNPSELLNSPRFTQLIAEAREEFDVVLVDCPPILPVTDAAIVGRQVDWAVLVYQVGKVQRNALRRAQGHMENVGAHVLGIAMNDVKAEIGGYSPYSQYMTKYYGEELNVKRSPWQRLRRLFRRDKAEWTTPESEVAAAPSVETGETWIDIEYFDNGLGKLPYSEARDEGASASEADAESGGEEAQEDLESPAPEEEEAEGDDPIATLMAQAGEGPAPGKVSLLRRIPLWLWILLLAAVVIIALLLFLEASSGETTATPLRGDPLIEQAAQPPPPGPTEAARTTRSDPSRPWTVQVASYRDAEEAHRMIERLRAGGGAGLADLRIESVEVPGLGVWHRIYQGRFTSSGVAEAAAARLARETGIESASARRIDHQPRD